MWALGIQTCGYIGALACEAGALAKLTLPHDQQGASIMSNKPKLNQIIAVEKGVKSSTESRISKAPPRVPDHRLEWEIARSFVDLPIK